MQLQCTCFIRSPKLRVCWQGSCSAFSVSGGSVQPHTCDTASFVPGAFGHDSNFSDSRRLNSCEEKVARIHSGKLSMLDLSFTSIHLLPGEALGASASVPAPGGISEGPLTVSRTALTQMGATGCGSHFFGGDYYLSSDAVPSFAGKRPASTGLPSCLRLDRAKRHSPPSKRRHRPGAGLRSRSPCSEARHTVVAKK